MNQNNPASGIFLVLLLLILVHVSSCKKFLDEVPDSKLTVPTTLPDLQALLDNSSRMNIRQSPSFGEGSSDDYFYWMQPITPYRWRTKKYTPGTGVTTGIRMTGQRRICPYIMPTIVWSSLKRYR